MTESKLKPMRAMQLSSPGWQKKRRERRRKESSAGFVCEAACKSAMSGMRKNVKQASKGSGRSELSEAGSAHAKKNEERKANRRKEGREGEGKMQSRRNVRSSSKVKAL